MNQATGDQGMQRGIKAGAAYFAIVFAAGFVLGAIRTLVIAPATGEVVAVAIELPVMLAVSWFICGWAVGRYNVPGRLAVRSVMGLTAFGLLMAGELSISVFLFDRGLAEHLALYREPGAQLGLAAQILFGLFPLVSKRA